MHVHQTLQKDVDSFRQQNDDYENRELLKNVEKFIYRMN